MIGYYTIQPFTEKYFRLQQYQLHNLRRLLPTQNIFQSAITCSKLTIETLEQGVKYVQS